MAGCFSYLDEQTCHCLNLVSLYSSHILLSMNEFDEYVRISIHKGATKVAIVVFKSDISCIHTKKLVYEKHTCFICVRL